MPGRELSITSPPLQRHLIPGPVLIVTSPHLISRQLQELQPWWHSLLVGLRDCFKGRTPCIHSHLISSHQSRPPHHLVSTPARTWCSSGFTHHTSLFSDPAPRKVAEKEPSVNSGKKAADASYFKGQANQLVTSSHHNGLFSPKWAVTSCTNIGRGDNHLCQQHVGNILLSPQPQRHLKMVANRVMQPACWAQLSFTPPGD